MTGNGIRWAFGPILILIGSTSLACGGAPLPQARLTAAQSDIRAAEVGGAEEVPQGKLHLKYARDQVEQANQLIEDKKYEAADLVLQRAQIDAKYALAIAEHEEARAEAEEVLEEIDQIMNGGK